MARPILPRNAGDGEITSDSPDVPSADPKKRIPIYPVSVRLGQSFSSAGIFDANLFPSRHRSGWADGWVGLETRAEMLRHPKVYQGLNNLKNAIIGDGGRWIPAINPYGPDKEFFAEAVKYTRFLEDNWRMTRHSFFGVTRQMLSCIENGNKLAAPTLREQSYGRLKGMWLLDKLQLWPNECYSLGSDQYGEFDRVITRGGMGLGVPQSEQNVFPRERFHHLAWRPYNGNPYGSTVLAPVYDPYLEDIQAQFENGAYMATWGRPSVIIFSSPPPEAGIEDEMPLYTRDGAPIMEDDPDNPGEMIHRLGYSTEQNAIMFTDFQAGSIWSLEHGSIVQVVEGRPGGADLFHNTRKEARGAIMDAIYGTRHATEGDKSPTAAGAELTEGVAGLNVTEGRMMLEQAEEVGIGRMVLSLNYGDKALDLMPIRDYGSGQTGRFANIMNATVSFASNGSMTRAQYWDFSAQNGLPLFWPEDEPVIFSLRRLSVELASKMKAAADAKAAKVAADTGGEKAGGGDKGAKDPNSGATDGKPNPNADGAN